MHKCVGYCVLLELCVPWIQFIPKALDLYDTKQNRKWCQMLQCDTKSLICLYKLFWLMIWDLILSGCKMSHHEWLPQVTGNSQFDHWCQSYFWALTSHFNDFFRCERCLKQSQTCSEAFVQNLNLVQLEPGRFSKSLVWNPKVHFLGSNPG